MHNDLMQFLFRQNQRVIMFDKHISHVSIIPKGLQQFMNILIIVHNIPPFRFYSLPSISIVSLFPIFFYYKSVAFFHSSLYHIFRTKRACKHTLQYYLFQLPAHFAAQRDTKHIFPSQFVCLLHIARFTHQHKRMKNYEITI